MRVHGKTQGVQQILDVAMSLSSDFSSYGRFRPLIRRTSIYPSSLKKGVVVALILSFMPSAWTMHIPSDISAHRPSSNIFPYPQPERPQVLSLSSLPAVPIDFGKGGIFSLSPNTMSYHFKSEEVLLKTSVGVGYLMNQSVATWGADAGFLTSDSSAMGVNVSYQKNRTEAVLNAVKYVLPLGISLRGAVSYAQGNQDFTFFRSTENAKLSQVSYYGSASWIDTGVLDLGFQKIGVSSWGGKGKSRSNLASQVYVDNTPAYVVITEDQRLLSGGRLMGASFDFQYAPGPYFHTVLQGSVGAEQINFPFSDGSAEKKNSLYLQGRIDHELDDMNTVGIGYKYGVVENSLQLEWSRSAFAVSGFYSKGQNGLIDQSGIKLTCDVMALFDKPRRASRQDTPLAIRMRPVAPHLHNAAHANTRAVLEESIRRPTQLPSTFMVKVDPTAVRQILVEKATLPSNANVDGVGNIFISVGSGNGHIDSVQVNGGALTNTQNQFFMQGNQLVVVSAQLSKPTNTDSYVIFVTDGTGSRLVVTFDAVNG